jgi:hypothetical protein
MASKGKEGDLEERVLSSVPLQRSVALLTMNFRYLECASRIVVVPHHYYCRRLPMHQL